MPTTDDASDHPDPDPYRAIPEDVRRSIEQAVYHPDPIRNREIQIDVLRSMAEFEPRKALAIRLAAEVTLDFLLKEHRTAHTDDTPPRTSDSPKKEKAKSKKR